MNHKELAAQMLAILEQRVSPADRETFLRVMKSLSVSRRGLSSFELCRLTALESEEDLHLLISNYLDGVLDKLEGQWMIEFPELKEAARRFLVPEAEEVSLHQAIVKSYKVTLEYSMPLLEEKVYHLYKAKDFSGLKQFLSDLEHFLLFFTPFYKPLLFKYWTLLEQAGFEPVTEYLRTLEAYESRASLSAFDLVKVILQLSRFFKELSDFESTETPEFSHPKVLNKHTIRGETENHSQSVPHYDSPDPFCSFS